MRLFEKDGLNSLSQDMETIDFVITWVDGNDPIWIESKNKYFGIDRVVSSSPEANSTCRYQDYGLLKFWFRTVEQFAPWVNKIHFITCGQKPAWLNEANPKLNLVNHADYIPSQYLPTFNSNTIELNLHRLDGLSEHFVLFNDDMFLLQPIEPSYFFKKGNPVLTADLRYPRYLGYNNWGRFLYNDYCVVNKSFNIRKHIWENRNKWFSLKELGFKRARQNLLCFLANKTLPVGIYGHFTQPHLKSTFQEIWDLHPEIMDNSSRYRFRHDEQVNQYLMCAWNQAKGCFEPALEDGRGRLFEISPKSTESIIRALKTQQYPQACINDSPHNVDSADSLERIINAFNLVFPKMSSFELPASLY